MTKMQQKRKAHVENMKKHVHDRFHTLPKEGCIYCEEQYGSKTDDRCQHCADGEEIYKENMCYLCYFSAIMFLVEICEKYSDISQLKEYAQNEFDYLLLRNDL